MADVSVLVDKTRDVVPLRLQTPPKAFTGAGTDSPLGLPTPPRHSLSTPPKPPSYMQATSAPGYKQIPAFDQTKGSSTSGSNTPVSGTPLLGTGYPTLTPDARAARGTLQARRQQIIDEFCKPEGVKRNYGVVATVCAFGIPLFLGVIALIIYLSLRPELPRVTIHTVKVTRLSAVGGADAGGENAVLNLDMDFVLLAMNPNKRLAMNYMDMSMLVSFENTTFPLTIIPAFSQKKRNVTLITTRVKATNAALQVEDGAMMQYCISKSEVPLRALIDVKACVQTGKWKTPSFRVHWACDLSVCPPSSSRTSKLLSKSCKRTKKSIPASYVTDQNILD